MKPRQWPRSKRQRDSDMRHLKILMSLMRTLLIVKMMQPIFKSATRRLILKSQMRYKIISRRKKMKENRKTY